MVIEAIERWSLHGTWSCTFLLCAGCHVWWIECECVHDALCWLLPLLWLKSLCGESLRASDGLCRAQSLFQYVLCPKRRNQVFNNETWCMNRWTRYDFLNCSSAICLFSRSSSMPIAHIKMIISFAKWFKFSWNSCVCSWSQWRDACFMECSIVMIMIESLLTFGAVTINVWNSVRWVNFRDITRREASWSLSRHKEKYVHNDVNGCSCREFAVCAIYSVKRWLHLLFHGIWMSTTLLIVRGHQFFIRISHLRVQICWSFVRCHHVIIWKIRVWLMKMMI